MSPAPLSALPTFSDQAAYAPVQPREEEGGSTLVESPRGHCSRRTVCFAVVRPPWCTTHAGRKREEQQPYP